MALFPARGPVLFSIFSCSVRDFLLQPYPLSVEPRACPDQSACNHFQPPHKPLFEALPDNQKWSFGAHSVCALASESPFTTQRVVFFFLVYFNTFIDQQYAARAGNTRAGSGRGPAWHLILGSEERQNFLQASGNEEGICVISARQNPWLETPRGRS